MHTFIAFLRAVNLAGHNAVKMRDVSSLFSNLGFTDVKTYIQSGNIIFRTDDDNDLTALIENEIQKVTGFSIDVMIRTPGRLHEIIARNPFSDPAEFDPARVAVIFLKDEAGEAIKAKMSEYDFSPDEFIISEKEVFIFCPGGFGKSKLTTGFFEKKLGIKCTARNWNTVNMILGIAEKL
jgi:uncharacterized protein (DUF1697 family)